MPDERRQSQRVVAHRHHRAASMSRLSSGERAWNSIVETCRDRLAGWHPQDRRSRTSNGKLSRGSASRSERSHSRHYEEYSRRTSRRSERADERARLVRDEDLSYRNSRNAHGSSPATPRAATWSTDRLSESQDSYRYVAGPSRREFGRTAETPPPRDEGTNPSQSMRSMTTQPRTVYMEYRHEDLIMRRCAAWEGSEGTPHARHTTDGNENMTYGRLVTSTIDSTTGREEIQTCLPYCGAVSRIDLSLFLFVLTKCVLYLTGGSPFLSFPRGLTSHRDWCDG